MSVVQEVVLPCAVGAYHLEKPGQAIGTKGSGEGDESWDKVGELTPEGAVHHLDKPRRCTREFWPPCRSSEWYSDAASLRLLGKQFHTTWVQSNRKSTHCGISRNSAS